MPNDHADLEISPRDAQALGEAGRDYLLIDCRTPQEHEIARLEGARLVPMERISDELGRLKADDRPIVVHCHTGVRSLYVVQALRQAGLANARSLAGGIHRWSLEIDPTVPTY